MQVIVELNLFLIGWINYYRYAACRFDLQCLDEWIRHRLRCYRLKQRKRGKSVAVFLRSLGVSASQAAPLASSGKRLVAFIQLPAGQNGAVQRMVPLSGSRFPGSQI